MIAVRGKNLQVGRQMLVNSSADDGHRHTTEIDVPASFHPDHGARVRAVTYLQDKVGSERKFNARIVIHIC